MTLSFKQWYDSIYYDYYRSKINHERFGQFVYNRLGEIKPELNRKAIELDIDPFYDDRKLEDYLTFIGNSWND